jgi:hypothetical protein
VLLLPFQNSSDECGVLFCPRGRLDYFLPSKTKNVAFYFVFEIALTSSSAFILLAKSRQKANSKTKTSFKTATKLKAQSKCGEMCFFSLNPEILQILN